MTMLNISCFPLGNSVRLERDLVFHRNMSNFGTDCRSLGSCVFLFYFFILFFCLSAPKYAWVVMHNAWGFLCAAGKGCESCGISLGKGCPDSHSAAWGWAPQKPKQKKRKRSLKENMKFVCFLKFPVQITVRYLTGFHLNQGHERKCRALFVKSIIN